MRRRIAFSVLAIAALLASATPAFANGSVEVYPSFADIYYATSADSIHDLGWVQHAIGAPTSARRRPTPPRILNHVVWSLVPGADALGHSICLTLGIGDGIAPCR
jgi:hypothetical protein